MKARSVRIWSIVHRWTSLASTIFLLLLCLTGLPLIFHHEIDEWLGYAPRPEVVPGSQPKSTVDRIADAALASDPGKVLQYIAWDKDEPGSVIAYTNGAADGKPDDAVVRAFGAHSAKLLGPVGTGPMLIVLKLHTDMFAGIAGKLFLGGMGLLFLAAIISGVILYWPFTRRLQFGMIRQGSTRRVVWLDWHNLIGITTVVWAVVVGGTGVINTWAELMLSNWRTTELASMLAPYAGTPPPAHLALLDSIVANAMAAAPGMEVAFIAFPGTPFSSSHHFAVFMRGNLPLTSRLLKPILLDGATAEVADMRELPVYLKALFISQPLHFGDYAGMPLKIIWAVLDVLTIAVIGSGPYLWAGEMAKKPKGTDPVRGSRDGSRITALKPKALKPKALEPSALGNRAVDTSLQRVFRVPIAIGVLSLSGLMAALLSAGYGRYFAWMAVGSPLIVIPWFGFLQFRASARRSSGLQPGSHEQRDQPPHATGGS